MIIIPSIIVESIEIIYRWMLVKVLDYLDSELVFLTIVFNDMKCDLLRDYSLQIGYPNSGLRLTVTPVKIKGFAGFCSSSSIDIPGINPGRH